MTTRDEYNSAEWDKYVAGTAGAAPPSPLKCSSLDCTGDIADVYAGTRDNSNAGLPQTLVKCDTCTFGIKYPGWRIANHA